MAVKKLNKGKSIIALNKTNKAKARAALAKMRASKGKSHFSGLVTTLLEIRPLSHYRSFLI